MIDHNATLIEIIESWKCADFPLNDLEKILNWIEYKNKNVSVRVEKISFTDDSNWFYNKGDQGIVNSDRTFFKIVGLKKESDEGCEEQPIIIQNEIGFLGIICKKIEGVLYFLMQGKIEPGNINKIQISPTIQATRSNFLRAHGGSEPPYLEYFTDASRHEVIVDQIQSEHSSRFLGKRNRNIIIKIEEDIQVLPSHMWMTLKQIKTLMKVENLVNMDTRTVISCIPFSLREYSHEELAYLGSLFDNKPFFNSIFNKVNSNYINKIFQYINDFKMLDRSVISTVDLYSLKDWSLVDNKEYSSPEGKFKIVYCDVSIDGREVHSWRQPLIEATGTSVFGLIYTIKDDKIYMLVQAVSEVGCFDKIEIGPSVQIGPNAKNLGLVEQLFLKKLQNGEDIHFSGLFSEEGGRFYHEQNRNVLMFLDYKDLPDIPSHYFWVDFNSLNILVQFNNCLNIQLRNLLSILDF